MKVWVSCSYVIVNIRLNLVNFLLLKLLKIKEQGIIEGLLPQDTSSVSVLGDIYIWPMMQCTWKAPASSNWISEMWCNWIEMQLDFWSRSGITEPNHPGNQENIVFFQGFFFKSWVYTRHCHFAVWPRDNQMIPGSQLLMVEDCILHLGIQRNMILQKSKGTQSMQFYLPTFKSSSVQAPTYLAGSELEYFI